MNKLKCMLGKHKSKNADCSIPSECQHCGHEIHEADRRKQKISVYGLTQRRDGLLRLVARR